MMPDDETWGGLNVCAARTAAKRRARLSILWGKSGPDRKSERGCWYRSYRRSPESPGTIAMRGTIQMRQEEILPSNLPQLPVENQYTPEGVDWKTGVTL